MFKHILIPLDGSELAEAALPSASYLARALGASMTLVHVIEQGAPENVHGDRHLIHPDEAEAYLQTVSARIHADADADVDYHVHSTATADVARSIVEHQGELTPDLIVMCTHGRSGPKRILIGSIAQQVVAGGHTPVLLIRPHGPGSRPPFAIRTIMAPIDADETHEHGLDVACDLTRATGAQLLLLTVVPTVNTLSGREATTGKFMPGTTQAILQLAEDDLKSYLSRQVLRIRKRGVAVSAELRRGDISPAISEAAEVHDAGIIVLATHGRTGNDAFWSNSVGAGVQARTCRPLLLVPVKIRSGVKKY